jgi:hypothetical protein
VGPAAATKVLGAWGKLKPSAEDDKFYEMKTNDWGFAMGARSSVCTTRRSDQGSGARVPYRAYGPVMYLLDDDALSYVAELAAKVP